MGPTAGLVAHQRLAVLADDARFERVQIFLDNGQREEQYHI